MDSGCNDEATQCKEFDFTDRSDLVDTLIPDYVMGHIHCHMVHKCRWLPVDGTGIGSDFARSIRATSIPTPCEMEGGQMRHNPGNTKYLRNKYFVPTRAL